MLPAVYPFEHPFSSHEAGGLASNSGAQAIPISPLNSNARPGLSVQTRLISPLEHHLTLEDIQENVILSEDAHLYDVHTPLLLPSTDCLLVPRRA